jgi:acyl dehydratase
MNDRRTVSLDDTREYIGREHAFEGADAVSLNDIRRKLEVYCFECPLHYDDAAARAHGFKGLIAPAVMTPLWAMPPYWSPGEPVAWAPDLREQPGGIKIAVPDPYAKAVNAASEWEYFEPLYPGNRLQGNWKLLKIEPKQTRLGDGAFFTFETELFKSTGEKVAVGRNSLLRYNPAPAPEGAKKERVEKAAGPVAAEEPVTPPQFDWSRQLRFADVNVGDEIPTFSLWLSYQRIVMSIAVDRMFSPIHHNRDQARANGLADIIFNTRGYEMMFEITLRRWMGLDGRLTRLGPFKMGASSHPGDVVTCRAKVVGKEAEGNRVKLEISVTNARGVAASGEAEVALP